MTQRDFQKWLAFVLFAALMQGCMGFKPENTAERIGWGYERVENATDGLASAYDANLVRKEKKDQIIDDYIQPAKDLVDEANADYLENGGGGGVDVMVRKIKVLIAYMTAQGFLEAAQDD